MLPITSIVEEALRNVEKGSLQKDIRVVREFEEFPPAAIDRHKILQILLNLIQNATEALLQGSQSDSVITVRVRRLGGDQSLIQVQDNGVGIDAQAFSRLFSFGFTTKRDGHGFGLHLGAIAAKQLGGSLSAESDGLGRGATFSLVLSLGVETDK